MYKILDNVRNRFPVPGWFLGLCVGTSCVACSAGSDPVEAEVGSVQQFKKTYDVDVRRSLVVTDKPILERFSFERVMTQLVQQSGVPGLTPVALFQQWWDTQNPGQGLGMGPHCDDEVDPELGSVINGYPYLCRPAPAEGSQAACDPFEEGSDCAYIPIALFNRFDQAPADGANCGEHRIIFAKASGIENNKNRNTIIFEARVPNPVPQLGLRGCRQIVETWADLTAESDIEVRADELESFYFDGLGAFIPPVVSVDHYGDNPNSWGQVRTNQLVNTDTGWSMREFKLLRECDASGCTAMRFVPVTNKGNAFGGLFDPASTQPLAADFRAYFPSQVASLAANDLNLIGMAVPDQFNTAQSQSSGDFKGEMLYLDRLGSEPSELRTAIEAELVQIGSSLSVDDIVLRAQATTCAGCHRLSSENDLGGGLVWPDSDPRFVHVTERETEIVNGVERFVISVGLTDVFLPQRKIIVDSFLNNLPLPPSAQLPGLPMTGRPDHG